MRTSKTAYNQIKNTKQEKKNRKSLTIDRVRRAFPTRVAVLLSKCFKYKIKEYLKQLAYPLQQYTESGKIESS